jgi:predicted alpha-1,2-mannosidase
MIHGATRTGRSDNDCYVERQQLAWYELLGYIPHEFDGGVVAVPEANGTCTLGGPANVDGGATALLYGEAAATLEYATDDFAIARMAAMLGDGSVCRTFVRRAGNWRTLWNGSARYLEPRYADGSWVPHYDPNANDFASATSGFTEGDSAQYTWMVPFDYAQLASLMGGDATARQRLDRFFTVLNSGQTGPYAYLGNEPTLETPWIYDWLGAPYKTEQVMRRALLTLYPDTPDGLPGNDDLGTMSSWYVLGALGVYPQIPGTDILAIGSPLFPKLTVHLAHGLLTVEAPGAPKATYVHRLLINNHPSASPWLRFASIAKGATLRFALGPRPDPQWGSSVSAAPPSYAPERVSSCAS